MTTSPDQPQRLQALDPSKSFIVQAPAGSGKTELLVGRYLTMLATVQFPEEVLAITFTRKAAMEMQMRILEALQKAKSGVEPEAAHELTNFRLAQKVLSRDEEKHWHLLDNPQRMRLSTIDSLAAQITAQLPVTAHFGEHYGVAEDASTLYEKAVDQLVQSLRDDLPWVPALERLMLYLDNRLDVLKSLLTHMLMRREMWLDIVVGVGDQSELKTILQQSVRTLVEEGLSRALSQFPWGLELEIKAMFQHSKEQELLIDDQLDSLDQWQELANFLLTATGTVRKSIDKRQGFLPKTDEKTRMVELLKNLQSEAGFIEVLNLVQVLPQPIYEEQTWQVTSDLLTVLKALAAFLRMVFKSQSEVDFNEIALLALDTLGPEDAPTEVMLKLDYRLSHLLVDEYQDTSLLQYRLFSALTRGWQADDGRTLFFVGDPMQSIYRFRQAEVSLFIKTIEEGLNGRPLNFVRLTANFRSQAGVIDWINQNFVHLFPAVSDPVNGAVAYNASTAIHAAEDDAVILDLSLNEVDLQITQLVTRLSDRRKQFPNDSMAILVRARSHLKKILPALSAAGLPYHGVDIEQLSERAVIQDLLSLTYAIYQLDDRLSWMALLRSPMFGLTVSELLQLADEPLILEALEKIDHPAVQRALPLFQAAMQKRQREPIAALIRALWLGLRGPACVTDQADVENAERFFECLRSLRPNHQLPSRERLETRLQKLYAERTPAADNPISVMTIHKSKGLEFDCVAIPMLEHGTRAEDKPLLLWQDLSHMGRHELMMAPHHGADRKPNDLYEFLFALEKDKSAKEMVRLFYVAATRAKQQLILSGTLKTNAKDQVTKPKSGSLLSLLADHIDLEDHLVENDEILPPAISSNVLKRLPADWIAKQTLVDLTLPEAQDNFNHPEKPAWDNWDSRAVGTIVHRYLEIMTLQGLLEFQTAWLNSIQQQLKQLGVMDDSAATRVKQAIEAMLVDETGRWILSDHAAAHSEWALSEVHRGEVRQFVIDRSFVADGVRWIIDYKTAVPAEEEVLADFLKAQQEKYAAQLNNYARLVSRYEQNAHPIKLMLYFPLVQTEVSWSIATTPALAAGDSTEFEH